MKKILIALVVIILLGITILVFNRNLLARIIIVNGIKKACGLGIDIEKIDIGLPSVSISGLKVYNPSGFKDRIMADIPKVYAEFDLPAFFKNKVHLPKIELDVKEVNVILNEKGKLNVNSLALLPPKPKEEPEKKPVEKKTPEVQIDELSIKIGKVTYKGYFPGAGEKTMEFNPNIDKTMRDVTNPSSVVSEIMKDILARIGISGFAQFDIKGAAQKALEEAGEAAKEPVQKATEGLKELFKK